MKPSFFQALGTGLLGFLFCLSLSIVLILHFRPLYVYEMKSQQLSSEYSMPEEEILEQYDTLIRYNSLFYRGALAFPSLPMSEEGRIHFTEVKQIFDGIQILLLLTAVLFLPLAFFQLRRRQTGFLKVIPVLSAGAVLLACFSAFLDWDALFTTFHEVVFQNDYWLFDPDTDPIINFLPDSYFLHCLLGILLLLICFSLICVFLRRHLKKKDRAFS